MIRVSRHFLALALVCVAASPAWAQVGAVGEPTLFQAATAAPRLVPSNISVGVVSFRTVAEKSQLGKAALGALQALQERKAGELKVFETRLQGLRTQRQAQASVVTDAVLTKLDRDIDKTTRDLQHAQQEAEVEFNDLRTQLMDELQKKVVQAVALVAKDKALALVLDADGLVYADPGIDLSDEVVKRLDALAKS